jgi:hypothetical protein
MEKENGSRNRKWDLREGEVSPIADFCQHNLRRHCFIKKHQKNLKMYDRLQIQNLNGYRTLNRRIARDHDGRVCLLILVLLWWCWSTPSVRTV